MLENMLDMPTFEEYFIYIGQITCVFAALYMAKKGQRSIGVLFLVAFLMQIQASYMVIYMDMPEDQGLCWASGKTYYDYLPILFRASIHVGQLGTILLGVVVILAANKIGAMRD